MSPPETRTRTQNVDAEAVELVVRRSPAFAHWIPRVLVAAVFFDLGFAHLSDFRGFADMFGLSHPVGLLVAQGEFTIAVLLLVGGLRTAWSDLATRGAGALIMLIMIGAIAEAHWFRWRFEPDAAAGFPMGGMEFQVVLIALGLFFMMRGASHHHA